MLDLENVCFEQNKEELNIQDLVLAHNEILDIIGSKKEPAEKLGDLKTVLTNRNVGAEFELLALEDNELTEEVALESIKEVLSAIGKKISSFAKSFKNSLVSVRDAFADNAETAKALLASLDKKTISSEINGGSWTSWFNGSSDIVNDINTLYNETVKITDNMPYDESYKVLGKLKGEDFDKVVDVFTVTNIKALKATGFTKVSKLPEGFNYTGLEDTDNIYTASIKMGDWACCSVVDKDHLKYKMVAFKRNGNKVSLKPLNKKQITDLCNAIIKMADEYKDYYKGFVKLTEKANISLELTDAYYKTNKYTDEEFSKLKVYFNATIVFNGNTIPERSGHLRGIVQASLRYIRESFE